MCVMFGVFLVEGSPTLSLPSLTDISSKVTSTDMTLIASTMSSVLYAVARKLKDVYQLGQQQVVVMIDLTILLLIIMLLLRLLWQLMWK